MTSNESVVEVQDAFDEQEYERLAEIQDTNGFKSVWCVDDVRSDMLETNAPAMSKLIYGNQVHIFGKPTVVTWLEVWRVADKMIRAYEPTDHVFIELIYNKSKRHRNVFHLFVGS
jgi:hypothetical protein